MDASPQNNGKKRDKDKAKSHLGHRERIRKRIVENSPSSLADYELLEAILFYVFKRGDTKQLAKDLLDENGKSLQAVFHASYDELTEIEGIGDKVAILLVLIHEVSARMVVKSAFGDKPLLQSWSAVLDHCRMQIGHMKNEAFLALYLDSTNKLISQDLFETGTVNKVTIYPREVVKSALKYNAVAVIIVHNHPSGNTTPSKQDIAMTNAIQDALKTVDIILHDHIIISKSQHDSFKQLGLL